MASGPLPIERGTTVLSLVTDKPVLEEPCVNEAAVNIVEGLLADLKAGRAIALAYASTYEDGTIRTAFSQGDGANAFTLLGAIERLKLRFHKIVCEDPNDGH